MGPTVASDLRLAQCLRCKGYTLLGDDNGLAFAVDVAATDRDGFVAAVMGARATWDVRKAPGRPLKGRGRGLGSPAPTFTPEGAQEAVQGVSVHVEHGCGAGPKDQRPLKVDAGKASRPATPGVSRAGSPPPAAPAGAARGRDSRSPATPATRRPSDGRCGTCSRPIRDGETYWGIQHGHLWIYCEHEECP